MARRSVAEKLKEAYSELGFAAINARVAFDELSEAIHEEKGRRTKAYGLHFPYDPEED